MTQPLLQPQLEHLTGSKNLAQALNFCSVILPSFRYILFPGTFKLKKLALQREGYNPEVIADQMYFLDAEKGAYRQLDHCLYDAIVNSRLRI